jgi:hypothetical protein
VVLDAQAVEDTAGKRIGMNGKWASLRVLVAVVGLALETSGTVRAQDSDAPVESYLAARDDQLTGEISGSATGDAARPEAPPVPYEGVSVVLLPYSAALEAELDAIKLHLRDSLKTYLDAATAVSDARAGYERTLLWAGGGELIRGEVTDSRGRVRFANMPAGQWLMLAWRTQLHPGKAPKTRREETSAFRDQAVRTGYSTVSYWRMPLSIRPLEAAEVDLNDRNVWLTAIHEDLHVVEGPPRAKKDSQKRR